MEDHNTRAGTGASNVHAYDAISQSTAEDEDGDEDVVLSTDDASDDYIAPTTAKSVKGDKKATQDKASKTGTSKRSTRSVSKLEREIKGLSMGDAEADDSVIILPNRKLRQGVMEAGSPGVEYVPGKGEVDAVKKKKRCAG